MDQAAATMRTPAPAAEAGALAQPDMMPTGLPLRALPIYYFLHIQKTAGTTMRNVLRRMFGPDFVLFTTTAELLKQTRAAENPWVLDAAFYGRYMLVGGHVPFNHAFVQRDVARRRKVFLAMWREPVKRVVSHYDYIRRRPNHHLHAEIMPLSLAEAWEQSEKFREISINYQLTYTFGTTDLGKAVEMLGQNNYVLATTQHLEAFVDAVSGISGLPRPPSIPRVNTAEEGEGPRVEPAAEQADYARAAEMIAEANAAEAQFIADHLARGVLVTTSLQPVRPQGPRAGGPARG
jgi:hypothetical protein